MARQPQSGPAVTHAKVREYFGTVHMQQRAIINNLGTHSVS